MGPSPMARVQWRQRKHAVSTAAPSQPPFCTSGRVTPATTAGAAATSNPHTEPPAIVLSMKLRPTRRAQPHLHHHLHQFEVCHCVLVFVQGSHYSARSRHEPALWFLRSGYLCLGLDVYHSAGRDVGSVLGWWCGIRSEDAGRRTWNSRPSSRCALATGGWTCVRRCAVREGESKRGATTRLRCCALRATDACND